MAAMNWHRAGLALGARTIFIPFVSYLQFSTGALKHCNLSLSLELANAKFRSAVDTAAHAAPLRRKQPWTGRQPPHLSCYPW